MTDNREQVDAQTLLEELSQQRNIALDQLAQANAMIKKLQARIRELEEAINENNQEKQNGKYQ